MLDAKAATRFHKHYNIDARSGCWLWKSTGGREDKYGGFRWRGKTLSAHRVGFALFKGEIPEGMCVCHQCDSPRCVNPDHLFLGTHKDNMRDMYAKGRGSIQIGGANSRAKLTEPMVARIIQERRAGAPYRHLAAKYGVSKSAIGMIVTGRNWQHISQEGTAE